MIYHLKHVSRETVNNLFHKRQLINHYSEQFYQKCSNNKFPVRIIRIMNYLYRCGIGISTEIFLEILGSACSKARTFPGKTKKKAYLRWQFSARSTDKGNHPFCSSKQSVISFFLNGQEKKKKETSRQNRADPNGPRYKLRFTSSHLFLP